MKTIRLFGILVTIGFLTVALTKCGEEEPLESCAQEEFCPGINVTSCCTVEACVYKYDGKEYTEAQESELATELGCSTGGARIASEQKNELILQLQALMAKAKAGLY